jgi:hypothetical protein
MAGEIEIAGIELHRLAAHMAQHRRAQPLDAHAHRDRLGQAEHLVERRVKRDQVELDERSPRPRQLLGGQPQAPRQRRIGVVAQAMNVGDAEQEQIQRPGADVRLLEVVLAHQAMVEPAEMLGYLAQAFRVQDPLGHAQEAPPRMS